MPSLEYIYSELPAIELFQALGYQYYNASKTDERKSIHEVLLKDRLEQALKRLNPWMDANNLNKAMEQLTSVSGASLMEINQKIWKLIRGAEYTVKQEVGGEEGFHAVRYLDYTTVEQNDFLVVNQMKYKGRLDNSIPDLVVYVNGLPLVVIECKSPTAGNAWDSAYSDLNYYQKNVEKLFYYNQFCVGLWQVGGRYGAITAPPHFYSVYKPSQDDNWSAVLGANPSQQDILIYALFRKEVLLDLIRHFVLFELDEGTTIKKLPRYQQLRATNKTIAKLQAGEGGVVWHTQGSGKSITMAYVTRKLQAPEFGFDNPTVIVMTDRKDLDQQITTTFQNVGFKNVHQASSVTHLDKLLRNDYGGIITTTLQKFQETESKLEEEFENDQTTEEERGDLLIEKILKEGVLTKITKEKQGRKWVEIERVEFVLEELSDKENLYILVDEAHRSQYGFLAAFMRTVLPKAKFVAFTGTPISKEDKSTLGEFYGGNYIDVYTIKESVEDGATVPLLYDEGIAKLDVKKEELDKEFEEKFGEEPIEKREKLIKAALKKYQLSWGRIEDICHHIITHYNSKIYPDGHKAMIVCNGRLAALRYQEILLRLKEEEYHDFTSKVIISLGTPKSDPIAKTHLEHLEWNKKHPDRPKPVLLMPSDEMKAATEAFKLPFGDESETEKSGQKKHDNTHFLIVSDMLLTGYDAPIASCLYLDKPLKEHNLLQAIARVNRSRKGKNAGYIVDYNGISAYLIQALEIFSGDLRPDDILKNLNEELPKLEMEHTKLVQLFRPLKIDRHYERALFLDAALKLIEPIDQRDEFKTLLKAFNKAINVILPNPKAMKYQNDFKLFNELKLRARNAYPEDEEFKITALDNQMLQAMIDEHLKSTGVENLLSEPISIIDKDKFKQEILNASPATKELKMKNNLKHVIRVGLDKNPAFFKPLAQRLEDLLQARKEDRLSQRELLLAFTTLQDEIIEANQADREKGFDTPRKRAVFNTMKVFFEDGAAEATLTIFDLLKGELEIIGWETKGRVLNDMEAKVRRFLTTTMERSKAKEAAKDLVTLIKKNKDA
ncbi:type I restriction endonuclease subunit R [Aureispira sp. CCB-E]|uniref:type I restriction endonuclease subunit R n=1 Tax=Aureispira sp. CCB-E TaxID=3051121 RepID=UPI0028684F62|nr:type I restriction endonuclease subunit R [Aureispira sp. CCB-E]WMX16335.1 type I restriction endonuclease subunit R [Aureispira sp. CCB-E]